jgi:hypothetical protein
MFMRDLIIKGASGYGDSIYLYPIVKYFLMSGYDPIVMTNFPFVFKKVDVETIDFNSDIKPDILCNYFDFKEKSKKSQFYDMKYLARVPLDLKLEIDLEMHSSIISGYDIKKLADGKKICVIKNPSVPHMAKALLDFSPSHEQFQKIIDTKKDKYFFVSVGYSKEIYHKLNGIDLDLCDKTLAYEILYLCDIADMILTQSGFLLPIGEALDKPTVCIMSRKALKSENWSMRTIRREKVKCGESSIVIYDDEDGLDAFERAQLKSSR